jgi:hypothetical protein
MRRCDECKRLGTTVQIDRRWLCSACVPGYEPPSLENLYAATQVPALRENIWCLRLVENQNRLFDCILIRCPSNVEAIKYAVLEFGPVAVSARPIEIDEPKEIE